MPDDVTDLRHPGLPHSRAGHDAGRGAGFRARRGAADRQSARPGQGRHSARADRADGRARLLRHPDPRGIRRPRPWRVRVLPGGRGAGAGLDERRQHHRPRQLVLPLDPRRGRGVAAQDRPDGPGPVPGRGRAVGAWHRFRPFRRHLPRAARRRRMGDHRQQVLVHVRRRRRLHQRAVPHRRTGRAQRPRRHRLGLGGEAQGRAAGRLHRQPDPQDRLLRLEDLGAALRGHPHAGPANSGGRPDRRAAAAPTGRSRSALASPAPTPPPARSAWRAARWKTPSPTPRSASSSASRSPTSRPSASRSPAWPPRSRPRGS